MGLQTRQKLFSLGPIFAIAYPNPTASCTRFLYLPPMRIAHVLLTHSFAGSERHAIELANAQAKTNEVAVVLHERGSEDRPDAIAHRLDPAVKRIVVGGWRWFAERSAKQELLAWRPEIVHAHLGGGCRVAAALPAPIKRLATLHIAYKRAQHAKLDGVIAIAPWQLDAIPAGQRRVQIDNWVRPASPAPDERERLRREHAIAPDAFLIGALGRAEASKGWDELIEAFEAANLGEGVRLAIVGGGRDWKRLRSKAPKDIVMPGFVARPQDWFAGFDAFVSAARSEPFGLVFLEAMSAGPPILATASQGASHLQALIERPLPPVRDVQALAQALRALVAERPARRAYALERFSADARIAEVQAFYEALMAH